MKIICAKNDLASGVQTVYKAVSAKATIPTLSGIMIQTTEKGLRLVAYDMELGIETFIPANIERQGSFVFPARYLSEIVRKIPPADIELDFDESLCSVNIKSDKIDFNVKVMSAEEFPKMPDMTANNSWTMKEKEFKKMVKKTAIAASNDDNRTYLTGIYNLITPQMFTMVATDSFRLACREIEFSSGIESDRSMIVPAKTLLEIERNLSEDGERDIEVGVTERHSIIKIGDTTYISRLLEGQFPNYKKVFPQNIQARITVDKNVLFSSVERVSLMCKDDLSAIKCVYNGQEGETSGFLTITANTPEVGQAKEDILVSIDGNVSVNIALRARYLKDVLKVIDGENIVIGYTNNKGAIEIKDVDDPSYTYLVMPVTSVS